MRPGLCPNAAKIRVNPSFQSAFPGRAGKDSRVGQPPQPPHTRILFQHPFTPGSGGLSHCLSFSGPPWSPRSEKANSYQLLRRLRVAPLPRAQLGRRPARPTRRPPPPVRLARVALVRRPQAEERKGVALSSETAEIRPFDNYLQITELIDSLRHPTR